MYFGKKEIVKERERKRKKIKIWKKETWNKKHKKLQKNEKKKKEEAIQNFQLQWTVTPWLVGPQLQPNFKKTTVIL